MRRALLAAIAAVSMGCANLVKGLSAEDRKGTSTSLLFATIRGEAPLDELGLERIAPEEGSVQLTSHAPFQLFRAKHVHLDAFVAPNLPPGIYRLAWFRIGGVIYTAEDHWMMRVEITEPGVYDGGAWVVTGEALAKDPAPDPARRTGLLRDAVKGTRWAPDVERLLPLMAPPAQP